MEEEEKDRRIGKSLTKSERHYWELAEVYIAHYENHMDRENKLMIAKGVTTEMVSDLVEWKIKNKPNSRFQKQWDRLLLIEEALDTFGSLSSTNIQIKRILTKHKKKIEDLELENEDLKRQLEIANAIINEA